MAFSLGIISYTISALIEQFEEAVEDFEEDSSDLEGTDAIADLDKAAAEVFDIVSTISADSAVAVVVPDAQSDSKDADIPISPSGSSSKTIPKPVIAPVPKYENRTVNEYYLKYNYDFDDIPNTVLRNSFAREALQNVSREAERRKEDDTKRRQRQAAMRAASVRHEDGRRTKLR